MKYDYHFIIKELAEEIEGQFTSSGKNAKKYIASSVPIEKELTKIVKKGKEIKKAISYKLEFIDSARFMTASLSNLVNNLAEGIHKIKWKYRHDDKYYETYRIKYKDCDGFLEYTKFKDNLREYKCFCCNKK